jgi:hypothetical protein
MREEQETLEKRKNEGKGKLGIGRKWEGGGELDEEG